MLHDIGNLVHHFRIFPRALIVAWMVYGVRVCEWFMYQSGHTMEEMAFVTAYAAVLPVLLQIYGRTRPNVPAETH